MTERPNLWDQVRELEGPLGERLSGEPEIVHEAQDHLKILGAPIGRNQIQMILENVPDVFPEDWQNPGTFEQLSEEQKKAGLKITRANPIVPIYGALVQEVIEYAVSFRDQFGQGKS